MYDIINRNFLVTGFDSSQVETLNKNHIMISISSYLNVILTMLVHNDILSGLENLNAGPFGYTDV